MAVRLAPLILRILAGTEDLEKGLDKASKILKRKSRELESAGRAITASLSIPAALAGAAVFKMAGDFDKAMAQSTAIMGDLSQSMRRDLADTAREVANKTTFAAKETAQAYFFLASAGLDAAASMAALPAVASFATAGQFDLARATDLLTDAQSALGLSSKDAATNLENMIRVSDVLVRANTLANATTEQFSESLTNKAGASLRQLGKDIEEGAAVLAVYADQGTKGAGAGEQLAIVLRDLQVRAIENKEAFRAAGVEVFDASGEMRNMADVIEDLERHLAGMSDEQRRVALSTLNFSDKSIGALIALIGTSAQIRKYEEGLRAAGGTTDRVANAQIQNLSDRAKILGGRFADVAITVGSSLAPGFEFLFRILEGGASVLATIAAATEHMPDALKVSIVVLGALTVVVGPLLILLGKLGTVMAVVAAQSALLTSALNLLRANGLLLGITAIILSVSAISQWVSNAQEAAKTAGEFDASLEDVNAALKRTAEEAENNREEVRKLTLELKANQEQLEKLFLAGERGFLSNLQRAYERLTAQAAELKRRLIDATAAQAGLDNANVIAKVERAWDEYRAALVKGEAHLRATHDEIAGVNDRLQATHALLIELAEIGEGEEVLGGLRRHVANLKGELEALTVAQTQQSNATQRSVSHAFDWIGATTQQLSIYGLLGETETQRALALDALHQKMREAEEILRDQEIAVEENKTVWQQWGDDMRLILEDQGERLKIFGELTFETFQQMTQGIGKAVGQAIFFGENFGKSIARTMKQAAANFVAALIDMGIQLAIFTALSNLLGFRGSTRLISQKGGETFASQYAAVTAAVPFPANLIAAPFFAALSAAAAIAGGKALAFEKGGFTLGEGLAFLHPNEAIIPLDRAPDVFRDTAPQTLAVNLYVDGERIARRVVRALPGELDMDLRNLF